MKRITKALVSLLLLISILLLSSCGVYWRWPDLHHRGFPEGYTGGWGSDYYGQDYEYFWVETYDELLEAIEKLESHGSSFAKSVIFNYEGELFDVKYCFSFGGNKRDYIRYGEDPFDRFASDVAIFSVAFTEDVSIEKLMLSYVDANENYTLSVFSEFDALDINSDLVNGELIDNTYYGADNPTSRYQYKVYNDKNKHILSVVYSAKPSQTTKPSEECINAVIDSIEILDMDK